MSNQIVEERRRFNPSVYIWQCFNLALFLVFLVLKLNGTIDWSWWWVTAPLWYTYALAFIVLLILTPFFIIWRRRNE